MEQATFSELEHDSKKRRTRRELFLEKMDGLVPWEALEALVEPFYPKPGRGRRPYPLRTMLRAHCVQLWYRPQVPPDAFRRPRFATTTFAPHRDVAGRLAVPNHVGIAERSVSGPEGRHHSFHGLLLGSRVAQIHRHPHVVPCRGGSELVLSTEPAERPLQCSRVDPHTPLSRLGHLPNAPARHVPVHGYLAVRVVQIHFQHLLLLFVVCPGSAVLSTTLLALPQLCQRFAQGNERTLFSYLGS